MSADTNLWGLGLWQQELGYFAGSAIENGSYQGDVQAWTQGVFYTSGSQPLVVCNPQDRFKYILVCYYNRGIGNLNWISVENHWFTSTNFFLKTWFKKLDHLTVKLFDTESSIIGWWNLFKDCIKEATQRFRSWKSSRSMNK